MRRIIAASLVVSSAALFAPPNSAFAASLTSSCTATKLTGFGGISAGEISAKVSITLNFTRNSNGTIKVTSAGYSFSDVSYQPIAPPLPAFGGEVSGSSNVNVLSPVTRNSPDSMGSAGTYDFTDFTVAKNTQVRVQGIPDIRNISDPQCSVYINVA